MAQRIVKHVFRIWTGLVWFSAIHHMQGLLLRRGYREGDIVLYNRRKRGVYDRLSLIRTITQWAVSTSLFIFIGRILSIIQSKNCPIGAKLLFSEGARSLHFCCYCLLKIRLSLVVGLWSDDLDLFSKAFFVPALSVVLVRDILS